MANKFLKATYYILILVIAAIAIILVFSAFPVPGNFETKIVLSGSMEPAIKTGSIVVIKPADVYKVDDVITFGKDTKTEVPTTHRIISIKEEKGASVYTTKGDANENADSGEVRESEVIGKVLLSVPYIGYLLAFARRPMGFALLVGIPAIVIIYDELVIIWSEIRGMRGKKKKGLNKRINSKKGRQEAEFVSNPQQIDDVYRNQKIQEPSLQYRYLHNVLDLRDYRRTSVKKRS